MNKSVRARLIAVKTAVGQTAAEVRPEVRVVEKPVPKLLNGSAVNAVHNR
jgi:hypothetical protein